MSDSPGWLVVEAGKQGPFVDDVYSAVEVAVESDNLIVINRLGIVGEQ